MNPLSLAIVLAMMLWGGGWPALKILSENVTWEVVTFWRFALMSIAFIPVLWWHNHSLRLVRPAWIWVTLSGLLNALFMGLSFWGVKVATAGAGGVIITTLSPIITVLIAILFIGFRPSKHHVFGLILGLAGGIIMTEIWEGHILSQSGNAVFLLCALTWSILTLSAQRSHLHLDPILYTFYLGVSGTVIMFFVAFPQGIMQVFAQGWKFWSALIYLAVFGQTIASTIYFVASGKMGSGRASSFMLLVPVFALISSYLLLNEIPSPSLVIGGLISVAAVYWINFRRT